MLQPHPLLNYGENISLRVRSRVNIYIKVVELIFPYLQKQCIERLWDHDVFRMAASPLHKL